MTKTEFLQQLYNHLMPLAPGERDDIISDFEDHFTAGTENGKTEEQICEELGNPYTCALQYLRQTDTKQRFENHNEPVSAPAYASQQPKFQQHYYGEQVKGNPQRNRVFWGVMFVLGIITAVWAYPAGICLMIVLPALIIAAVFAGTFTASAAVVGLLISVGVALFSAGLFMVLFMTWFLKLSWRRADL